MNQKFQFVVQTHVMLSNENLFHTNNQDLGRKKMEQKKILNVEGHLMEKRL